MPLKTRAAAGTARQGIIADLRALVAALDRRVPHIERAGEAKIARDAAELRSKAMKRLEDLERER